MQRSSGAVGAVAAVLSTLPLQLAAAGLGAAGPARQSFLSHAGQHVANITGPEEHDYNEETYHPMMPVSVEFFFASLFVLMMASVPGMLVVLVGGGKLTPAHKIESMCLIAWLVTALFLFTNVLKFSSGHFAGARPLTLVEAVYLLAQILTTVGYGDITPAFPRGQVWVAINVIIALCLYGSIVMEVAGLLVQRLETVWSVPDEGEVEAVPPAQKKLKEWDAPPPKIDMVPLEKWALAFIFFATVGVLFWHYFPGENKTWLQAVYMSVITLSTVGFGFFNATTEGGKVFGAFWMLCGVASLAGLIGAFVELIILIKAVQRRDPNTERLEFFRLVKNFAKPVASLGDDGVDSYDFLKFGVLLQGLCTEEEVEAIEARFAELAGADGKSVSCAALTEIEGPPAELLSTPPKEA